MYVFSTLNSVTEVPADEWNSKLPPSATPFLSHEFLSALEETGCVSAETGWTPCHLISEDRSLILPAYIKTHSYGEYVFDWSWAEAYANHGLDYYPKLLIGIPFTPVPGPRALGHIDDIQALFTGLNAFCEARGLTGWHMNFVNSSSDLLSSVSAKTSTKTSVMSSTSADSPALRDGCQFIWRNRPDGLPYQSFDEYLSTFVSRKRKTLLKERRKIAEQELSLKRLTGADISADDIGFFYHCYRDTYLQRRSMPYLSEEFFQKLRETMHQQMMLVIAEDSDGPCAAALCFHDDDTLYGRYWGCIKDYDALHFEACYYQGIEFCIERELTAFNPGTQGEHKISRGFAPEFTHSLHWLAHPGFQDAVQRFTSEERQHIQAYADDARTLLPFHRE